MNSHESVSSGSLLQVQEPVGDPFSRPNGTQTDREAVETVSTNIHMADFVRIKFLPEYIQQRSPAGRRHYQAMLKHILRPDTVDNIFQFGGSRLIAIPGWPYLDKVRLCQLREHHVRDLIEAANTRGYSAQTVKHIRAVLSVIIAHAKRERLFENENPVTHVEPPPLLRTTPQQLTIAQAKAMLGMMESPEREIAFIAITTGMSMQEICGLQWKYVNLSNKSVQRDQTVIMPNCILVRQHWYCEVITNLHSNRVRVIEIHEPLVLSLVRLKHQSKPRDSNSFVVTLGSGEPVRPAGLRKSRLIEIGRRIAIPSLSWRHINRAHSAIVSELRARLSTEFVSSARLL